MHLFLIGPYDLHLLARLHVEHLLVIIKKLLKTGTKKMNSQKACLVDDVQKLDDISQKLGGDSFAS